MSDSAGFALHRPELLPSLQAGEEKIKAMMVERKALQPDHVLIKANTRHDFVYRIREGWAARVRQGEDGRQQIILTFLPGDLFAVKSMFVAQHPDRVQTLSNAVVDVIDWRVLHSAFGQDPDIANRCIWQVVEEERRLHSWVFGLGQGNAEERLGLLICDFRGRLVTAGVIGAEAVDFELPLSQAQLADHLGITAVHMNRVVKNFRESGVATVRGGSVTIHSLPALHEIAMPLLDDHERRKKVYGAPAKSL